jgi:predicted nucleic acid-binding Zn ribbon protein
MSYIGTKIRSHKCLVCGSPILIKNNGRGRKKEYCSTACSDFVKYYNAFERSLELITFSDKSYLKKIKGDLFVLVNTLHQRSN